MEPRYRKATIICMYNPWNAVPATLQTRCHCRKGEIPHCGFLHKRLGGRVRIDGVWFGRSTLAGAYPKLLAQCIVAELIFRPKLQEFRRP